MAFEVISTLLTATYTVDPGDDVYIAGPVVTYGLIGVNDGAMSVLIEGAVVSGGIVQ